VNGLVCAYLASLELGEGSEPVVVVIMMSIDRNDQK
jgi:hypothetical protein